MTKIILDKKRRITHICISSIGCVLLGFLMIIHSKSMKIGAIQGMKIAFESVVPTLFPFFILSDIWSCYFITDKQSFVAKLFEKLFFIPSPGISAFIAGNVCGFPLGVTIANKLYLDNNLSREQATILCGISNNPSDK